MSTGIQWSHTIRRSRLLYPYLNIYTWFSNCRSLKLRRLILLQAVTAFSSGEREYASYLSEQVFYLKICPYAPFEWSSRYVGVCTCLEGGSCVGLLLFIILCWQWSTIYAGSKPFVTFNVPISFGQCLQIMHCLVEVLELVSVCFAPCLDASPCMYLIVYCILLVITWQSNVYEISLNDCRGSCRIRKLERLM